MPASQESSTVENVDHLSRLRLSHSHHNEPDSLLTLSFQSKIDAVDSRLRVLDDRFVDVHQPFMMHPVI